MPSRRAPPGSPAGVTATGGFTLPEMLAVVALLAILAAAALPGPAGGDDRRLEAAASEVRETLRFARAEAMRRNQGVLFDAESSPGRLKLSDTDCTSAGTPKVVVDPRTKRAFDVNVNGGPFSAGVVVTPNFVAGGSAWGGVVFNGTGAATDACQVTGMNGKGTPQAGSGVVLSLGGRQLTVTLDAVAGRVTGP